MNGYCDGCENHCPLDNPQCGHGERIAMGGREGMREHSEGRPERHFGRRHGDFDGPRGGFDRMPGRGFDGPRGRFDDGPEDRFDGPRGRFDDGPEGRFDGPHGRPRRDDFDDRHHSRPPRDDFDGRDHGRPPRDDFDGRDHGRPPRDDFDGRGPHGHHRHPMQDDEALRQRLENAGLDELLPLCGRMMPHGQGRRGRGQNLTLSILAGREALSQRELQRMLGVQPGSLSELLTKLERKGLITRERGEDRRGNLLRITDAGRQAIADDGDIEDDPFSVLNDDQRSQLTALLKTLIDSWIKPMD